FSDGTKGGFDSTSEGKNVREIKLIDEKRGISVSLETGDLNSLWGYPIEALAQVEGGLERKFQGISLLLNRRMDIPRGSKWKNSIRLNID
ncbi:alpha-amylase/4-alpha-glucanotransferase domain-containing protein, partial [Candidatus Margulisiibacteriota bacterium]